MKKLLPIIIITLTIFGLGVWWTSGASKKSKVTNFQDCLAAGNPAMESYPRQCRHQNQTFVEELVAQLSQEEAYAIARDSRECSNAGILTDDASYNSFTRTWWIDLERMPELEKDGCNPACVVWEETKTAEVNWRCTGLNPSNENPTSADNAPEGNLYNLRVPDAVAAVRTFVASELGVSEGVVIVMSAYEKEWPNSCLGLAGEDEMYAQVITPGYEITIQAQGQERLYRTNEDGSVLRREE